MWNCSSTAIGEPTSLPGGEENAPSGCATGQAVDGTRWPLGSNFGSDTQQTTIGKSNYNTLQLSLRHPRGRLQVSAGYTYGQSLDESPNWGEEINPINPARSSALTTF
jgi:hypothetical protein